MSTYQRPLQPWDPIVQDQQIKPPIRYIRDNFQGTGQDSHTQPPAQDASMWQALTNIQPITKGVIERRWGFVPFATGLNATANRLVSFQRDSDGLRTILTQGAGQVEAFGEDGSFYTNVFNPSGSIVRSLSSRNYQYFFDGLSSDLKKWNGDTAGGVSNWGINVNDVTVNTSGGGGSSGTSFGPNPGNSSGTNFGFSEHTTSSQTSSPVFISNYGFAIASGTIAGIMVTMDINFTGAAFLALQVTANLRKNGVNYGTSTTIGTNHPTSGTYTFGSSSYLWGGSWTLADINASSFGLNFTGTGTATVSPNPGAPPSFNLQANIAITNIKITVFTGGQAGGTTSSGSGVGITSIAGGGNVNLTIGRTYYLAFFNANTGHFSDITQPSTSTGPVVNGIINLLLATSNDPQVTHKYLLATADGNDPSILYQVAELVNGGAGDVTTYADNTPETTLLLNQVLLFTDQSGNEFGITLNDPPPAGTLCIKHQGRLWMAGVPGATHSVFFSKAVGDLTLPNGFIAGKYEEAWPGDNYFDISDGAETVSGLLSDGQNLYMGSQYHIRRLVGNDPTNFQLPEIVHPQVGVLNQEVWNIVYTQGSPAGAIWLTPDFRVIQSDFNTYIDIGARIQDILNQIQPTAATLAHATFVADGEYDLFILAIPFAQATYCDLHLVYDMRHQQWFVWQPTNGSLSLLYNVTLQGQSQWLFIGGNTNTINQYLQSALDDNGTPFTLTAMTSWLGLGEPGMRKVLNEIDYDGDPSMTVSVFGALLQSDFVNPKILVNNFPSVAGPLGTRKFFIASQAIPTRYVQFKFQSTSSNNILLGSYNIESIPFMDL